MKLPIHQKKYQCSVCYYESDRAGNVRRHAEKIHALANTKHINTNNTLAIPPTMKASNINSNSGNVYLDEKELGNQFELRGVKTKSGGRNLGVGALRRRDILDDGDDYQMIKLFKYNVFPYSSERKHNVKCYMKKNHTALYTKHIKKGTGIPPK